MNWVLKEIFTSPRTTQTTDSYSIKKDARKETLETFVDNGSVRRCIHDKNVDNTGINQYDISTRKHSSRAPQDYVLELASEHKQRLPQKTSSSEIRYLYRFGNILRKYLTGISEQ